MNHLTRIIELMPLRQFCTLTGVHPVTVTYWDRPRSRRGVQPTPAWVGLLLDAWERCPELIPPEVKMPVD